jgi:lysophospholipase L1-like esterase
MFKSHRRSYRKSRRSFPLSIILLSIPLALILLELLVRIVVGVTGKNAELAAYEGQPASVNAYYPKFLNSAEQPYDGLSNRGDLAVQPSYAGGYGLVANQKSNYWHINEQGFRDNEPVPLKKPQGEIRIFLLGGSAAFGQWSASNQATLASKLEARLNERVAQQQRSPEKYRPTILPVYKPELEKALALPPKLREGRYRVINAAVPGYASGNELSQLALQILPYRPDAVIVLNGYTDLMLPSDQAQTQFPAIEAFLNNAPGHFWAYLTQQFQDWVTNTYTVKAIQHWVIRPRPSVSQLSLVMAENSAPLEQHLPHDSDELKRRVERYQNFHSSMVMLTTGANIPLVVAVQPEITGRKTNQLTVEEQKILRELGATYQQRIRASYTQLLNATQQIEDAFPHNVKTLNFYNAYENFPKRAFYDAVHLTEEGNIELAERLYRTIAALPKMQITPPKSKGVQN